MLPPARLGLGGFKRSSISWIIDVSSLGYPSFHLFPLLNILPSISWVTGCEPY